MVSTSPQPITSSWNAGQSSAAAIGLPILAGIVPLAGLFAHKSLTLLLIVGALSGLRPWARQGLRITGFPRPPILILVVLGVWMALTGFWALDPASAVSGTLHVAGLLLCGVFFINGIQNLDQVAQVRIQWSSLVGMGIFLVLIAIEVGFHGPIFDTFYHTSYHDFETTVGPFWLTTGVAIVVLMFWPIAAFLRARWGIPAAVLGFVAVLLATYGVRFSSGTLGLLVGGLATILVAIFGQRFRVFISVLAVLYTLAAPFIALSLGPPTEAASRIEWLSNAARHRLGIWSFSAQHILDHPVLGSGMNASKMIVGGKATIVDDKGLNLGMSLPLHPHNAALQMWLELGLPGALLYGSLIVAAIFLTRSASPLALGQLGAALTMANVSYGVWQAWWISALWMSAGLSVIAFHRPRNNYL